MKSCLDLSKLRNVREHNEKTIAQCPACAEVGGDDSSEHLFINSEGAFGCIKFTGAEGAEHRKRIFALAGVEKNANGKTKPRIVKTYDYHDEDGNLIFQVVRLEPKDFRQRRPDGNGGWVWDMKGVRRELYHLPKVLAGIEKGAVIFLVEGEKDVSAIESLNLCATCNPGGAKKWEPQYTESLTGGQIVIIADKDEVGRGHAELVARSLYGKAKRLRVIELPDLNGFPVKDAHDWVSAGGTLSELAQITKSVHDWQPGVETPELRPECFYYERFKKEYLLRNQRGTWLSLAESQFKKELISRNVSGVKDKTEVLSEVDQKLIYLRAFHDIDYAGKLAGYDEGFYDMNGQRILVTESPRLLAPQAGDWSMLQAFISGLLVDGEYDQISYLMGWLKVAYECLRSHTRRPGQALVLCGPRDCGKSLFQQLVTVILGGRMEKPYQYMVGATSFNSDLFKAEHLCIDDEPATSDIRSRLAFGAQIKQITAGDNQRCHGKGREALTLCPFWRLTISVNDEPESLTVLPLVNEGIQDKLILLKTCKHPMPMLTAANSDRVAFWNRLTAQIPAFLDYLTRWEITPDLLSQRYGVRHFHHPDVIRELDALAPEFQLLNIIRAVMWNTELPLTFEGSCQDLESKLTSDHNYQYDARKLLSWPTACGTYLARLAKKFPDNFIQRRTKTSRLWTIIPLAPISTQDAVS